MDLYLDINGVLLTKDLKPAEGVDEFLKFATAKFTCFWLTTHCKGDANTCVDYLRPILGDSMMFTVEKILPTDWQTLKTEAIHFDRPFLWLDDYLMDTEEKVLRDHQAYDSLLRVDLTTNPGQLMQIKNTLQEIAQ